jgi:hypothetical protein
MHLDPRTYVMWASDGSIHGGMELEIVVVQEGAGLTRFFFWSTMSFSTQSPCEESAMQVAHLLQGLYGFMFTTKTTRECKPIGLARCVVVLVVS